ncbi:MAG: hypothetical protein AAF735_04965 [Myxococcota bacterium]
MSTRIASLLMFAALLSGTVSCAARARNFRAAAVAGDDVKVEPIYGRAYPDRLEVAVEVENRSDRPLVLDRNQMAVVGPTGKDLFRTGENNAFRVPPGGKMDIGVRVATGNGKDVEGFYFRLDGLYIDERRVLVDPLAFGKPQGDANRPVNAFEAPPPAIVKTVDESSLLRKIGRNLNTATNKGVSAVSTPGRRLGDNVQGGQQTQQTPDERGRTFQGRRMTVTGDDLRCATLPVSVVKLPKEVKTIADELLLSELQQAGFEAIGTDDINAMVGFEEMKDAAGCEDTRCIAEIGNALGVQYLATGKLTKLEDTTLVLLKLLDVNETRVVARSQKSIDGSLSELPRVMAEAVQQLVVQSKL